MKYTGGLPQSSFPHFPKNVRFVGDWKCGFTTILPNGNDGDGKKYTYTVQIQNDKFYGRKF